MPLTVSAYERVHQGRLDELRAPCAKLLGIVQNMSIFIYFYLFIYFHITFHLMLIRTTYFSILNQQNREQFLRNLYSTHSYFLLTILSLYLIIRAQLSNYVEYVLPRAYNVTAIRGRLHKVYHRIHHRNSCMLLFSDNKILMQSCQKTFNSHFCKKLKPNSYKKFKPNSIQSTD